MKNECIFYHSDYQTYKVNKEKRLNMLWITAKKKLWYIYIIGLCHFVVPKCMLQMNLTGYLINFTLFLLEFTFYFINWSIACCITLYKTTCWSSLLIKHYVTTYYNSLSTRLIKDAGCFSKFTLFTNLIHYFLYLATRFKSIIIKLNQTIV